ncbi:isoleucine-tRNA ligase [Spiromyces aspiralis]|uniref:Isoleucine-tRNA ligase n=1 Tax=Spiromyces aspiralis TaxID=68401 RepID=A0ACC1HPL1_9FUNG|nr:isoleucine-tRNA ligase [Spiromyces aspiralis]
MCHLAEETYSFARDIVRPPSGRFSVFQEQWDQTDAMWDNQELASEWDTVLRIRDAVNHNIERARQDKAVGSSLEVDVELQVEPGPLHEKLVRVRKDLKEACIVSGMTIRPLLGADGRDHRHEGEVVYSRDLVLPLRRRGVGQSDEALQEDASAERCRVVIRTASKHKCPRCWVYASEGENKLCARCDSVVHRSQ